MAAKWSKTLTGNANLLSLFSSSRVCSGARNPIMYSTRVDKQTRRKEIISELKKGYFADIREYQKTGGKRFMALNDLIPKEKALRFPTFTAKSLSERQVDLADAFRNHTTLLLIAMRAIGHQMCDLYRRPFCDAFKDEKHLQYFEINAVDSMFYSLFRHFIQKSMKTTIPLQRHDNYLCYYGSTKELKQDGLVENIVVGHAFLIDNNGLVRWRACATPTTEEIESLITCTQKLIL